MDGEDDSTARACKHEDVPKIPPRFKRLFLLSSANRMKSMLVRWGGAGPMCCEGPNRRGGVG